MKTTYKVSGSTYYGGFAPGETFDAQLSEDEERRAVARGSIRVVKRPDDDNPKTKKKED